MIQRLDRITWVALCVILALAPAARAENYAVFFAGGNNDEDNWEIYYDEILRHYKHVVDKWGYKPENVWVIFADGMNSYKDLTMWWPYDPENSDWSYVDDKHSTVLEASYDNTRDVLIGLQDLGPGDLFYFWSYDHGFGDKDEPSHHDEEGFSGWNQWENNDIADDVFAGWVNPIGAGRHAYVLGQCYSGGVLEELQMINLPPGHERFGCASATHQEPAQSSEVYEGFNDAWCDGVENEDLTWTQNLYVYAYEDCDLAPSEGPNADYQWGLHHPWMVGDNIFLPVCVWEGSGAGGASTDWEAEGNWSYWCENGSVRVAFDTAGQAIIDEPLAFGGYLTLNWDEAVGETANVIINAGADFSCITADIGQAGTESNPAWGSLVQNGGDATFNAHLVLGDEPYSRGYYTLNGGNVNVYDGPGNDGEMVVGNSGFGQFSQFDGNVYVSAPLYLGRESQGQGFYELIDGTLDATDVYVGYEGSGQFHHTSGSHTVSGTLQIGYGGGSMGTYTKSGGTLWAQTIQIGMEDGSQGALHITGGGNLDADNILLGFRAGSQANFSVRSSGDLAIVSVMDAISVGNHWGHGTFLVQDGAWVIAGRIVVGDGGDGSFFQGGGTVQAHYEIIGEFGGDGQDALYDHSAGTNTVESNMFVGGSGSAGADPGRPPVGRYNLSGTGVLDVGGFLTIGDYGTGDFTHHESTVSVEGGLVIGSEGGTGTYTMPDSATTSPALTVAGHAFVGSDGVGTGTFSQYHGTHTVGNNLYVGKDSGAHGTYELQNDAVLEVGGDAYVGFVGTGEFHQTGGTHAIAGSLHVGYNVESDGTYILSGGTLDVSGGAIRISGDAGGAGAFELNGNGTAIADEFILADPGNFTTTGQGSVLRVNTMTNFSPWLELGGSLHIGHSGGAGFGGFEIEYLNQELTVGGDLVVGYDAPATFVHQKSYSKVTAGHLVLGDQPEGDGAYTLGVNSAELRCENLTVGQYGTGLFQHGPGLNELTHDGVTGGVVTLAAGHASQGTYQLTGGGTLTAREMVVGGSGCGTFEQSHGTVAIAQQITIGQERWAVGTCQVTGGAFSAGSMVVGDEGDGTFYLRNTDVPVGGSIVLARQSTLVFPSSGTVDVEDGALSCEAFEVGYEGTGNVRQAGSSAVSCTTLRLGYDGNGSYAIEGGALTADSIQVAFGGDGSMTQSGGSVTVAGSVEIGGHQDTPWARGSGEYAMTGGDLSTLNLLVGEASVGHFLQGDGSDHTVVASTMTLGRGEDGEGTYDMWGGTLASNSQSVGYRGAGTFNQGGGSNTVIGFLKVSVEAGSHGTYNLESGDLSAGTLRVGDGPGTDGTFNWLWGTLDAPTVQVREGGTMNVSNSWAYGGTLEVDGGALNMDSGTKSLWLDAPAAGAQMLISGGSANPMNLTVGIVDKATVTQTGGTNTVAGFLEVGVGFGSEGLYDLQGGDLVVGTLRIGSGGQVVAPPQGGGLGAGELGGNGDAGQFNWTGGTMEAGTVEVNTNGAMDVAVTWPLNGYLYLYGGTINSTGPSISLGTGGGVMGQGGTGVAEVYDGTLTANCLCLGYAGTGFVNQFGGTVTGNTLWIGHQGPGEYTYEGGTLTMENVLVKTGGTLTVAMDWTYGGHLGVEGGTVSMESNVLTLDAPADGATAELSAGLVQAMNEYVGYAAKATVTQTGGDHLIGGALYLGHEPGSEGIYHLENGTLTVPELLIGLEGSGLFRWTGGTLNAGAITVGADGEFVLALTGEYEGDFHGPDGGKITVELGSEVTLSGVFGIDPGAAFGKDGGGTLIIDGPQEHGDGASFDILGGTVDMNTDAGNGGFVDVSILVDDAVLLFGCDQYLDTLALDNGALVRFTGAGVVVVQHLVMDGIDLGAATLTPEPATLVLLAAGALALLARRRRPARA